MLPREAQGGPAAKPQLWMGRRRHHSRRRRADALPAPAQVRVQVSLRPSPLNCQIRPRERNYSPFLPSHFPLRFPKGTSRRAGGRSPLPPLFRQSRSSSLTTAAVTSDRTGAWALGTPPQMKLKPASSSPNLGQRRGNAGREAKARRPGSSRRARPGAL